ncbi:MAG: NifB/NifX family molybdenum-iron cluster-binding protein [Candidatus Heimdallarchaeota archaeon]|nr:NifB/NifX family molybdenum-iron cluster-binding protein [Candidatus Heimdallarchaeota archaeon]
MKLLIPSIDVESDLNSQPSKIFGNAKSFIMVDTCDGSLSTIKNEFDFDKSIAMDLKDLGVGTIITEDICSSCFKNILHAGIDVYHDDGSITIRETYQKFLLGGIFPRNKPGNLNMHQIQYVDVVEKQKIKNLH